MVGLMTEDEWMEVVAELWFCEELYPFPGTKRKRRLHRIWKEMKDKYPEDHEKTWKLIGAKLDAVLSSIPASVPQKID